jgi:hypothetical protein
MIEAGVLGIGQAFYGSFSGYHDYRILAASPAVESGFTREEREIISLRSNLGGSAQTAPSFAPFFTFYELGRQRRWAFSRTVWLGRGSRGNDYLAHVLALDSEVMEALRGDPFLLLGCGLFREEKPRGEETLKPLSAPLREIEAKADLPCGAGLDPRIEGMLAAGFLRAVARGTLAVPLDDGEAAAALCRSIVSLLPPDDRENLSFCSRFSLPRRTPFRLAVYAAEDAPLVERYLDATSPAAAPGSGDSFSEWVAACQTREIEPFYGISLVKGSAAEMLKIVQKLPRGESLTPAEEERLEPIVLDRRNRWLPSVQRLILPLAWKAVRSRVDKVLSAGSHLASLEEACRQTWSYDSDGRFLETKIAAAASQRGSGEFDLVEVTAVLAMAVLIPDKAMPERILATATAESPALFRSSQLASWTLAMSGMNREACKGLLTSWFVAWFRSNGPEVLQPVLAELQRLKDQGQNAPVAAMTAFSALWDVKPEDERMRTEWRTGLLQKGRGQLGSALLSDREIGRLVLQERHLAHLPDDEARSLLDVTCSELPSETEAWLEREEPPLRLLLVAAKACTAGLGGGSPGLGWPELDARRWSLVARVADLLVRRTKAEPPERLDEGSVLAGLLFSAAVVAPSAAIARIASTVKAAAEAELQSGADLLLRAGLVLARLGDRTAARTFADAEARLKAQGERDFLRDGSADEVWGSFMLDAAWRKVETYAQGEG